ncbi:MAG: hypothetical protein V7744_11795 [Pseudomonadales bacterium]
MKTWLPLLYCLLIISCSGGGSSEPPPPCETEQQCMQIKKITGTGRGPYKSCDFVGRNGIEHSYWIASVKDEAKEKIFLSYDVFATNYWGTSFVRTNMMGIGPSEDKILNCGWHMRDVGHPDSPYNAAATIKENSRCFVSSPNCNDEPRLPHNQVNNPKISQCLSECRAGSEYCLDMTNGLPSSTKIQINLLAHDILFKNLPTTVDLNPLFNLANSGVCIGRPYSRLLPNSADKPTNFESNGQSCQTSNDISGTNTPFQDTNYLYKNIWLNTPVTVKGNFMRYMPGQRLPSGDINNYESSILNFVKAYTVNVQAEFYDPNGQIPSAHRYGSDRLNTITFTKNRLEKSYIAVLTGEQFLCASIEVKPAGD